MSGGVRAKPELAVSSGLTVNACLKPSFRQALLFVLPQAAACLMAGMRGFYACFDFAVGLGIAGVSGLGAGGE